MKLFEKRDFENINLILVDKSKEKFEKLSLVLKEILKVSSKNEESQINFEFVYCDLEKASDIDSLWTTITKQYGVVHILVNNAAIARGKTFREMSVEQYKQTISINLLSYVHLTHLFLFS